MKIVYWGTYDTGKPRNRILIRGMRESGVQVTEYHHALWDGVEDKSQVSGIKSRFTFLLRWLGAYPRLIGQFIKGEKPDAVVVGYLGHLDVLILWFFARLKKTPVIWDAFISLYDTVVLDRQMIGKNNPLSLLLYATEWLACKAADLVILDTQAHAQFFMSEFHLSPDKTDFVFVGAETEKFPTTAQSIRGHRGEAAVLTVLFYGQFIPLHGIETIVEAAAILKNEPIRWLLIGKGQESAKIGDMLESRQLKRLIWKEWVEYDDLVTFIQQADICLGIFGASAKASRVIPNKVFQIISAGKPLITRDSPAIRELVSDNTAGVILVPPASPDALAEAILSMRSGLHALPDQLYRDIRPEIVPEQLGRRFQKIIGRLLD